MITLSCLLSDLAQLSVGTLLALVRDSGNEADPNAIQVQHQGVFLGRIAWEIARPLAPPSTRNAHPASPYNSPPSPGA
ncbi:HIRAN domain-containing protein [Streptomyces massasporeus]|uniref:HIRAN domain-containing protein n=1 Tax=Streptomyces massasporeus TaxID=67324 RepID=UPI0033F4FC59